jgi:hypothetical protein
MATNTNEGELIIQSPEITSTVPSHVYMRRIRYFHDYHRPLLEPVLWNPNQENIHSRFVLDLLPSSLNAVHNGNVVAYIKCFVNDCWYYFTL